MPYLGLLPFLLFNPIFKERKEKYVSMPYLGLLPFLRELQYIGYGAYVVSMPYLGLLPFLQIFVEQQTKLFICVSMPYLGLLPFLPSRRLDKGR